MELIRGLYNWRSPVNGCVATIGNFDGVHVGHQAIFQELIAEASRQRASSVVVSFQPLPQEFFNPTATNLRIQGFRDRVKSIADCGVDRLLLLRFNQRFAKQSANAFIDDILSAKLQVKHLLVGDDFRFGENRVGDFALLQDAAKSGRFSVCDSPTVSVGGQRVSSTRVRELLRIGDCAQTEQLLGRPHCVSGTVVHGEKVGRQLGFPTANIALKNHRPLLRGVFAVQAVRENGQVYPAIANLGERPTVGGRKLLLEVHLLGQSFDLYGERLRVEFHHFIRGEKKFASLDELKLAISADALAAGEFFAALK